MAACLSFGAISIAPYTGYSGRDTQNPYFDTRVTSTSWVPPSAENFVFVLVGWFGASPGDKTQFFNPNCHCLD